MFCVSLDPKTNTLAVTGGEDDKAFVWRLSDGELLFECAGERLGRLCPSGHLGRWLVDTRQLLLASVSCQILEATNVLPFLPLSALLGYIVWVGLGFTM